MAKSASGTYVYCVVAARRPPAVAKALRGLAGTGPVRLLAVASKPAGRTDQWLVVADAPLAQYGEAAINTRLSDLDWVGRAAIAHEAVVESFIAADAVLPMKLFTIFTSDDRALDHVTREQRRIDAVLKRVAGHQEWGVRVILDRGRASVPDRTASRAAATPASGVGYLTRKKTQRDAAAELARRAREVVADLYDSLAAESGLAKRRGASELPAEGGPLLLDAAFLVPAKRSAKFRSLAARLARALDRQGYRVSLTGPWPPYSFIQD
jgi:hypothetical protein